jgi:hypothetical protein
VVLQGTLLKQIVSRDGGSGLTVTITPIDQANATNTVLGEIFAIAANATPGAHTITATLKNGKKVKSKQDFFVQIPASLVGTAFDGQFEVIGASGAGPLHTPNFGQNDFVFDASGTQVDTKDQTPVCGVYRNYVFQLYDQDQPAQPIHEEGITVTESLSVGPPRTQPANNAGQSLIRTRSPALLGVRSRTNSMISHRVLPRPRRADRLTSPPLFT